MRQALALSPEKAQTEYQAAVTTDPGLADPELEARLSPAAIDARTRRERVRLRR